MTSKRTTRDLLEAWAEAKEQVAGEFSSNLSASYKEIITEAKAYAADLGIPWDDNIISDVAYDLIEAGADD